MPSKTYDYRELEELLESQEDIGDLWNTMDELMAILVDYLFYDPRCRVKDICEYYFTLRSLRDFFGELTKQ